VIAASVVSSLIPTITDSIKALQRRGFILIDKDPTDKRCSFISLSAMGKLVIDIIHSLQSKGFIPAQKMCFSCKYYSLKGKHHYCSLLEQNLKIEELKINCPEHQAIASSLN